ncbi:MAG: amino acid adenylation domain-containing protein [Chloroflexota bacterium]|nr:amino acid adenylation domain-containing protein [Chloroflexota bacterium]
MSLRDIVIRATARAPEALAIKGPDGSATYGDLNSRANRLARALSECGVRQGDRVGIWLEKSVDSVAAMQGILRLNAIYVPLDPQSPPTRILTILRDCEMRALVTTRKRADSVLTTEDFPLPTCLFLDETDLATFSDAALQTLPVDADEIAYILYTSGSTGVPKGVCISNRNALAFIAWAAEVVQATSSDRFANHAPFHFDLSILDLYVAFSACAAVFLIPEGMSYMPRGLVDFIMKEKLTIWYSVPSALILMMEHGELLHKEELPLRAILFAGEPFPIKYLRTLYERWPAVRYLNLYGPTETNVCTFYEVTEIQKDRLKPVPIGIASSGDTVWAQRKDATTALVGEEGELMVTGPTVMVGYWGKPRHGDQAYATGDLVRLQEDGNYEYIGRRDHMVKVRGHRVELGDIEAALAAHPGIFEVAVAALGSGLAVRLVAFVVATDGAAPSLLEIKRHCAEHLPRYMIVDTVCFLPTLPRTRNGKVDRLALSNEDRDLNALMSEEKGQEEHASV